MEAVGHVRYLVATLLVALAATLLAPSEATAQRHHTVRKGQSLSAIARRYRVSTWDLAAANRMRPGSMIRPGQVLTVPARGEVYVRPGDSLSAIAARHDCSADALARVNRIRQRGRLRVGQRLDLPGYRGARASFEDRDWGEPEEPGVVRLRDRRGEDVSLQLVDDEGRVIASALPELAEIMRRHEEDRLERPSPRLAALLAAVSDHFGGRRLKVVSGFREAGGYTRETSRHVSGQAADIQVEGVPRRAIWEYCRTLEHTGCGFYPRSVFVHVDVRDHDAQWVDWSRPGRRPRYGSLRGPGKSRRRAMAAKGRDPKNGEDCPLEVELDGELPPLPRPDEPTETTAAAEGEPSEPTATAEGEPSDARAEADKS